MSINELKSVVSSLYSSQVYTYSINLAGDWAEKKQAHHVTSRIGRSSAAANCYTVCQHETWAESSTLARHFP